MSTVCKVGCSGGGTEADSRTRIEIPLYRDERAIVGNGEYTGWEEHEGGRRERRERRDLEGEGRTAQSPSYRVSITLENDVNYGRTGFE